MATPARDTGIGVTARTDTGASVPRIFALLRAGAFDRFRNAVGRQYDVRIATIPSLESQLREIAPNLLVVDPSLLRSDSFTALIETVRCRGDTGLLVYTALTCDAARAIVLGSQAMPIEVVFAGSAHERAALITGCASPLKASVPALVLQGLATTIAKMPASLATRIVGLFGGQPIPSSTAKMLADLGVCVDTARDWLASAGIDQPHLLRACALLARSFQYLAERGDRLETIVERVGAGSVRTLRRASTTIVGLPTRQAGKLTESEFARRLLSVAHRTEP
jgi:hypothetical protein